jgi:hypothetical protein
MKTFLCSHLVTLCWDRNKTEGNLEEISARSAVVNTDQALPLGTAVSITCEEYEMAGSVTSCEIDPLGYFVRVALSDEWTAAVFRPEHLFDPEN